MRPDACYFLDQKLEIGLLAAMIDVACTEHILSFDSGVRDHHEFDVTQGVIEFPVQCLDVVF